MEGVWARETEAAQKSDTGSESRATTRATLLRLKSGEQRFQEQQNASDFQRITSYYLRTGDAHEFGRNMSITFLATFPLLTKSQVCYKCVSYS